MRRPLTLVAAILLALPAMAQEETAQFEIGRDIYRAGQSVVQDAADAGAVFLAGERVENATATAGSAHLAGRWVTVTGVVGQNLYAAGQEVEVAGAVTGDATLAGQEVTTRGATGGNLRVFGSEVRIDAPVGGYALVAGEEVVLNATVAGDMAMTARNVVFGPDARIDGALRIYEDSPGDLVVPERVIPPERIARFEIEEWEAERGAYGLVSPRQVIGGFLVGVLTVTLFAALLAALAPAVMADLRHRVLDNPLKTLGTGFLAQSALIGAGVLLGMTVIGLLLTPAAVFLAILAGFLGYVVGAYALGVKILSISGRHDPENTADRALAAGVGALLAGLIGLVPLLGWIFVLALSVAGAGAIADRLLRPAFFVES